MYAKNCITCLKMQKNKSLSHLAMYKLIQNFASRINLLQRSLFAICLIFDVCTITPAPIKMSVFQDVFLSRFFDNRYKNQIPKVLFEIMLHTFLKKKKVVVCLYYLPRTQVYSTDNLKKQRTIGLFLFKGTLEVGRNANLSLFQ